MAGGAVASRRRHTSYIGDWSSDVCSSDLVTSAALVMVGVFSIFGSLSSLDVKQAGVGLAAAVLIDATIVRAVLLPSTMQLLGEWNWYLPRFLQRLPETQVEAPPAGEPL